MEYVLDDVVAVVMAGGQGARLRPLTDGRAKPAVPFAGIFRIVDFTLSNCINSGLRRIYVLTQYKSHSLSNHLKLTWNFLSRRLGHYIDEIPAQMQTGGDWYKGTADAIRQNMSFMERADPAMVLVLAGDHVYKMDYRLMRRFHVERSAAVTIAVARVPASEARGRLGVVQIDDEGKLLSFEEKPEQPRCLPGSNDCLVSMGIYLFNYGALKRVVDGDCVDFGRDVFGAMVARGQEIYAYDFATMNAIEEYQHITQDGQRIKVLTQRASDSDYWRDIGTVESYWQAHLDLVSPAPKFNLYGERWPIFNCPQHFAPAKFVHESPGRMGTALNSIVANGVIVSGGTVRASVLGPGIYVHSFSLIESSVLLGGSIIGGTVYETSVGRDCRIRNAIIDRNVKLPGGTVLGHDRATDEARGLTTYATGRGDEYVVVVPKRFGF